MPKFIHIFIPINFKSKLFIFNQLCFFVVFIVDNFNHLLKTLFIKPLTTDN